MLYEIDSGEKIYIQYPGKESVNNDKNKSRPWDFRPKIKNKNGEWMDDQTFSNIWDEIESLKKVDDAYLSFLASLFFRFSMLIDSKYVEEQYYYEDIDIKKGTIKNTGKITLKWYKLNIDKECIKYISSKVPNMGGNFSTESYLIMNDLLCKNEDCKYYYRDKMINKKEWNHEIGRHNTYRTHISIINFLEGNITFSEIVGMFSRQNGVAAITDNDIEKVTGGIIKKINS